MTMQRMRALHEGYVIDLNREETEYAILSTWCLIIRIKDGYSEGPMIIKSTKPLPEIMYELKGWIFGIKDLKQLRDKIFGEYGIAITATGPMILLPNDNGACNWQIDMTPEAIEARKKLIRDLLKWAKKSIGEIRRL